MPYGQASCQALQSDIRHLSLLPLCSMQAESHMLAQGLVAKQTQVDKAGTGGGARIEAEVVERAAGNLHNICCACHAFGGAVHLHGEVSPGLAPGPYLHPALRNDFRILEGADSIPSFHASASHFTCLLQAPQAFPGCKEFLLSCTERRDAVMA